VSGNRFLLDTNILLYLIGKKIPVDALPEGEFSVSFVTELEVLSYPSITSQGTTSGTLTFLVQNSCQDIIIRIELPHATLARLDAPAHCITSWCTESRRPTFSRMTGTKVNA